MAKFKIKTITHNGKWTNIEFDNGQKASADNEKEPKFKELQDGQEVDLDLKDWTNKKGEVQQFANFPKIAGPGSKFPAKDYAFEKRRASLEFAISAAKLTGTEVKTNSLLTLAETFHTYLTQK